MGIHRWKKLFLKLEHLQSLHPILNSVKWKFSLRRLLSNFRNGPSDSESLDPPRRHVPKNNIAPSFVSTRGPIFSQEEAICMFDFTWWCVLITSGPFVSLLPRPPGSALNRLVAGSQRGQGRCCPGDPSSPPRSPAIKTCARASAPPNGWMGCWMGFLSNRWIWRVACSHHRDWTAKKTKQQQLGKCFFFLAQCSAWLRRQSCTDLFFLFYHYYYFKCDIVHI